MFSKEICKFVSSDLFLNFSKDILTPSIPSLHFLMIYISTILKCIFRKVITVNDSQRPERIITRVMVAQVQQQVKNTPVLWLLVLHIWGEFEIRESWRRNTRATGGTAKWQIRFCATRRLSILNQRARCKHNCHINFVIVWKDQTRRGGRRPAQLL